MLELLEAFWQIIFMWVFAPLVDNRGSFRQGFFTALVFGTISSYVFRKLAKFWKNFTSFFQPTKVAATEKGPSHYDSMRRSFSSGFFALALMVVIIFSLVGALVSGPPGATSGDTGTSVEISATQ
jgi:hypothetical protein